MINNSVHQHNKTGTSKSNEQFYVHYILNLATLAFSPRAADKIFHVSVGASGLRVKKYARAVLYYILHSMCNGEAQIADLHSANCIGLSFFARAHFTFATQRITKRRLHSLATLAQSIYTMGGVWCSFDTRVKYAHVTRVY